MGRRRRGGQGNHGDASNTERAPSPVSDLPIASLPVPFAESHTTTSPASKIIPFWDKPRIIPFWEKTHNVLKAEGKEDKTDDAGPTLSTAKDGDKAKESQQKTPPKTPAGTVKNTTFTYKMSPNTILEDAGQYALNASISSGRFEDLRILAFSRRISHNRVGAPRAMYANSTLVTRALPNLFQDERLDEVSDAGLALCDDISVSTAYYGYGDDSDLEDDESDGPESSEDEADSEIAPCHRPKNGDETPENTPPSPVATQPPEDLKPPPPTASSNAADASASAAPAEVPSPPVEAEASDSVSAKAATTTKPETTPGPQVRTGASTRQKPTLKVPDTNARVALYSPSGSEGPRTIFAIDAAYRTWRAVVFYAYTHRVAFAPLQSQGLALKLAAEDDPSQLPICSPKSMYRLAMKYDNAELERLAGDDIASKLSTQNALEELFSPFTSRYPQIQDMELNFVVVHIKHPHIAVELPSWIDRFARGELKECAGTFGRLIHKLACAATVTVAPGGVYACPRGCTMSTVQHRCTM